MHRDQHPFMLTLTNKVDLKSRHVCGNRSSGGGEHATQPKPKPLPEGTELVTSLLWGIGGGANRCTRHS